MKWLLEMLFYFSLLVVCFSCTEQHTDQTSVTQAAPEQCANGGVVINNTNVVCNGSDGSTGAQGLPGAPGSTITPIPFCPSLPGNYPEYGLLIDGSLFAVYYDSNGAHLAKLVEGSYITTDGRSCSFSVDANNEVH